MIGSLPLWPIAASAHAQWLDEVVIGFTVLIVALSAPVFIFIALFAVKYRRGKPANRAHAVNRNVWVEVSWSVIPFLLIVAFFTAAAWSYFDLRSPPANTLEIAVVAKRWMWKFQHPEGQSEIDDLHVPAGETVKLVMTSQDVIHSLFLPALRLKQDVLPGRYTTLWFIADRPGIYALACTQFCGTDHSLMGGRFIVMTDDDYTHWLTQSAAGQPLAAKGKALFESLGCAGCHERGTAVPAPRLEGIYGRPVPLQGGGTATADDQYIRDSILLPNKDVVAGFEPRMPTFQGLVGEGDLMALVAYVKSLTPGSSQVKP